MKPWTIFRSETALPTSNHRMVNIKGLMCWRIWVRRVSTDPVQVSGHPCQNACLLPRFSVYSPLLFRNPPQALLFLSRVRLGDDIVEGNDVGVMQPIQKVEI